MYASLESHSELAARRGTAVELGDRVVVATLCVGFAIWFRDEKSQSQNRQTNRECQSARLSLALTSQPNHLLIQLRTECIPGGGAPWDWGLGRPPRMPTLRTGREANTIPHLA
jgi:hypothetical protein